MIELILSAAIFFTPNDTFYVRGEGSHSWFCRYDLRPNIPPQIAKGLTQAQIDPSPLRGEFGLEEVRENDARGEYTYLFGEEMEPFENGHPKYRYFMLLKKQPDASAVGPFWTAVHDWKEIEEWGKTHSGGRAGILNYECVLLTATDREL